MCLRSNKIEVENKLRKKLRLWCTILEEYYKKYVESGQFKEPLLVVYKMARLWLICGV